MGPDLRAVARATAKRELAEREWKEAITNAKMQNYSLREIGRVAGISHSRVHAICDEMLEGTFRN